VSPNPRLRSLAKTNRLLQAHLSQFKREPLTADEANRLASVCSTYEEKLIAWTLLDTGLRVAELAKLTKDNLDWQGHRLMVYGKGGTLRHEIESARDSTHGSRAAIA
jgi:integrase